MEIKATLLPGQNGTKQLLLVKLRIGYGETGLREQVKAAGGRWDPEKKRWELPYAEAAKLRLLERIVEE